MAFSWERIKWNNKYQRDCTVNTESTEPLTSTNLMPCNSFVGLSPTGSQLKKSTQYEVEEPIQGIIHVPCNRYNFSNSILLLLFPVTDKNAKSSSSRLQNLLRPMLKSDTKWYCLGLVMETQLYQYSTLSR
jgi:hypothetical protein